MPGERAPPRRRCEGVRSSLHRLPVCQAGTAETEAQTIGRTIMAKAKRRKTGRRKTAKRAGARKGKMKRRAGARKGARKLAAKRKTSARKSAKKSSARRKTAAKQTEAPSSTSPMTSAIPSLGGWRPFGSTGTDENK
jgi:hypothetical protein